MIVNTAYAQEVYAPIQTGDVAIVETVTPEAPVKSIQEMITETFGPDSIMHSVADCESRFRQFNEDGSILRGYYNPKDVGVFQVNEYWHLETSKRLGMDIYTVEGNIAYAKHLYDLNGTRDWNASRSCWGA